MSFSTLSRTALLALVLTCSGSAKAQFYSGGCSTCASAAPVQPAYSACYQTVPITTYKTEKMTVQEPFYKTSYEDREYTVYEPVQRKREIEVDTVNYRTVVENRTVHRDLGRWQTNYHPVQKCNPCQIDPRPGLFGWLNRTGYAFRSAMTPNYRTSRQYVPNMVACNVPTTRQVAVRGKRTAVVYETEMVARKKKDRVEVRKLAWRDKEVTVRRPVTAYRTLPIGSAMAYGPLGGSRVAYLIDDDDSDRTRSARGPEPDDNFSEGSRSADRMFDEDNAPRSSDRSFERNGDSEENPYTRTSHTREVELLPPRESNPLQQAPRAFNPEPAPETERPAPTQDPSNFPTFESGQRDSRRPVLPVRYSRSTAGVDGWKASRTSQSENTASRQLSIPRVSVVDQ